LREAGFAVELAHDGETGLRRARAPEFDLLIVDVMLPKKDGWEVVAELRRDGMRTAIRFLTARDNVRDRVTGLELEADDYLVKPFAFSELLALVLVCLDHVACEPFWPRTFARATLTTVASQVWGCRASERRPGERISSSCRFSRA
jgi:DNA-binding response OmpR family regulator